MNETHVDCVADVPQGARVLARTAMDPVAAFALGPAARAVQFHPEVDADVLRAYVRARAPIIRGEGLDPDAIHDAVRAAPDGVRVLKNFIRHFVVGPGRRE